MQSNLLKSELAKRGWSQKDLATAMHRLGGTIDRSSLNQKINGAVEFRQSEIALVARALDLSPDTTMAIFFAPSVS